MQRHLLYVAFAMTALGNAAARAQITQQEYAARRDSLATYLQRDGAILVVGPTSWPAAPQRPNAAPPVDLSLVYLTGIKTPGAVLVIGKHQGKRTQTVYVPLTDPARTSAAGSPPPAGAARGTQLRIRPFSEIRPALDSLLQQTKQSGALVLAVAGRLHLDNPDSPEPADTLVRSLLASHRGLNNGNDLPPDLTSAVRYMRGLKTPAEVALLRKAAAITSDGARALLGQIVQKRNARDLQTTVEDVFRKEGSPGPAFTTLIGPEPDSTPPSDSNAGDLGSMVVTRMGASYDDYVADVMRTVPVSGTFTPEQRAIYQLVQDAQAAGERAAVADTPSKNILDSTKSALAAGLTKLGLIESPTATYTCGPDTRCPQLDLFTVRVRSNPIGLEIYDVGGPDVTLTPGEAFTIEAGVSVRANVLESIPDTPENRGYREKLASLLQRYKNTNAYIGDDYVVTAHGTERISQAPRGVDEIEAAARGGHSG